MKHPRYARFLLGLSSVGALVAGLGVVSGRTVAPVTFTKDIAPILYQNCATCHRPGEMAPMSLLTFKDVRPWAKSIREKVVKREMTPWPAYPTSGEFANDPRVSEEQISALRDWVDGGAKEGNAADLPAPPKFANAGW